MLTKIIIETANGKEEFPIGQQGRTAITLLAEDGARHVVMVESGAATLTRFTRTPTNDIVDGWPEPVDITTPEPGTR